VGAILSAEQQQPPTGGEDNALDPRADARSNVFVMAALYSATSSCPVRIRNMSRGGALVEGGILPDEGREIRLSRGSLSVSGRVAWRDHARAGLRFDSSIVVADWLPSGNRSSDQQRVDAIVFAAKRGLQAESGQAPPNSADALDRGVSVAAQLRHFGESLDQVAEQLVADAGVAAQFHTQLQVLDGIARGVGRIASELASPPRR